MRNFTKSPFAFVAILCLLLFSFNTSAQNVGINTTGATPDNSALLDLSSEDKGFLITRADTGNIDSPAFGLMTLAPADSCLYMFSGETWIGLGGVGKSCIVNSGGTVDLVDVVTNPTTGRIWMDRNLGASQVSTSSTDALSYGDLYQWGRYSDGHEERTSGTTQTLSASDTPGHGDYIVHGGDPFDWRSPQNNNLWQGVTGINNPCPTGFRIPTEAEFEEERLSWGTQDPTGAFASPLKFSIGGFRATGTISNVGTVGYYWTSTIADNNHNARYIEMYNGPFGGGSYANNANRAVGASVRCIQD